MPEDDYYTDPKRKRSDDYCIKCFWNDKSPNSKHAGFCWKKKKEISRR